MVFVTYFLRSIYSLEMVVYSLFLSPFLSRLKNPCTIVTYLFMYLTCVDDYQTNAIYKERVI